MPTYKILAHECVKHEYIITAPSESEARRIVDSGDWPSATHDASTLEWEITDVIPEGDPMF